MTDIGLFTKAELVAGETVFSVNHGNSPVYRPGGMEGWVLNFTVSGAGKINRGAGSFVVRPGDILLFPPGVPHDYITDKDADDWVHLWVYFGMCTQLTGLLGWPEINGGVLGCRVNDAALLAEIGELLKLTVATWRKNIARKTDFCLNLLERALLLCDMVNPLSVGGLDRRVEKAISRMNKQLDRKIRLDDLAAACEMSVSRFVHLFTESTGVPPMKYLEKIRIEKARELLIGGNMKLAAIAESTGYVNEYYFSQVFKKLTGKPPGQYRKSLTGRNKGNV